MPKDEFDFDDPLELNGVAFPTEEDTSAEMAECFTEEFPRMGYNHKQVLALFRNPHYMGMNMVLQNKGEAFVRSVIAETFARWGRVASWPEGGSDTVESKSAPSEAARSEGNAAGPCPGEPEPALFDPMGGAIEILK